MTQKRGVLPIRTINLILQVPRIYQFCMFINRQVLKYLTICVCVCVCVCVCECGFVVIISNHLQIY
jgi:hypothetical protein